MVFASDRLGSQIRVDGKVMSRNKAMDFIVSPEFLFKSDFNEAVELYKELQDNKAALNELPILIDNIQNANAQKKDPLLTNLQKHQISYDDLMNLVPFVDIVSGDILLWDAGLEKISSITYRAWFNVIGKKQVDKLRENRVFNLGRFAYDPYNLEPKMDEVIDGKSILKINTYRPPQWRLSVKESYYPILIKEFIEFLFPIEKERSLLLTFLKHAIISRVSHILLLIGRKGVGKNIFVEYLVKNLVGQEYFAKTSKGFFKSNFQDVLLNNRIIFIDEIEAKDDESKKDLKRLPNPTQAVEKKRQDIIQTRIYYSAIIANNNLDDIYLESDDRRFFVPTLTDTRLIERMDDNEISKFCNLLQDKEFIGAFGNYLLSLDDDPDFNDENAYITTRFYEAVEASLKQTESFVLKYILDKGPSFILFKELQEEYGFENDTKYFKPKRIKEFIDNYLHEGTPLGEWKLRDGYPGIKVNERFVKSQNDAKQDYQIEVLD